MVTLQEYLNKEYPTKSKRKWTFEIRLIGRGLTNKGDENLSDFVNLEKLDLAGNELTSLKFLDTIPSPEKLKFLDVSSNSIPPTNIEVFSRFVNLETLLIGNTAQAVRLADKRPNQFYGSFESWKKMKNLTTICIEATNVDSGLEYLPISIAKNNTNRYVHNIQCSPHETDSKCKAIQDQLRDFNYDLNAWQLAHPEEMLVAQPELFLTNVDDKDKWIQALDNKIGQTQRELSITKTKETEKIKKIARLESKLIKLRGTKETLEKSTQTEESNELTKLRKENKKLKEELAEREKLIEELGKIQWENEQKLQQMQSHSKND